MQVSDRSGLHCTDPVLMPTEKKRWHHLDNTYVPKLKQPPLLRHKYPLRSTDLAQHETDSTEEYAASYSEENHYEHQQDNDILSVVDARDSQHVSTLAEQEPTTIAEQEPSLTSVMQIMR